MEKLNQEIADSVKFLAGAFVPHSTLPEVLLMLIWGYVDGWQISCYTDNLSRYLIPGIMPSIEPSHVRRTLDMFALHNYRLDLMMGMVCRYETLDQIRILDSLTHTDVIQIFSVRNPRTKRHLEATTEHYSEGKRGERMLAILMGP